MLVINILKKINNYAMLIGSRVILRRNHCSNSIYLNKKVKNYERSNGQVDANIFDVAALSAVSNQ